MPLNTGTYTLADLQAVTNQTIPAFGLAAVQQALDAELAIHNGLMLNMVSLLADVTAEPLRRVGTTSAGDMIEADDVSRAPTQKVGVGGTIGLPMRQFQTAVGWTQRWLNKATPAEIAVAQLNLQAAHRKRVIREMKVALYTPTNLDTFDLTQRNKIALPVKRFYNADGWSIPLGPNAEVFTGGSHTHYSFTSTPTASGLLGSIGTVVEHNAGGQLQTYINSADEASISALTGFKPYVDGRLIVGNTDGVPVQRLDIANPGNRAIGLFGLSEVWVKPWAVANYAVTVDLAAPEKPLAVRTENGGAPALVRVAENDAFPLIAQFYESIFGFGAFGRGSGAVYYFASGSAYAAPTIP